MLVWVLLGVMVSGNDFLDGLRPYQWRLLDQVYGQIPSPRAGHSMVTFGRSLLVFGGTFEWRLLNATGQLPSARGGHTAIMLNTRMYTFGGTAGSIYFNEMFEYDAVTNRWRLILPSGPLPSGRANHAAVLTRSGAILVMGGNTGTPPVPREQHSLTTVRGQLILFGGFHEGGVSDETYALDLTTMEWTNPQDEGRVPEGREGHSTVLLGDYLFVTGGCDYARRRCYSDFHVLDLTTMWWTQVVEFRGSDSFAGRERAAFNAVGQTLFLFGGCQLYSFCFNDLMVINTGVECPNDCSGNGMCRGGLCICSPGYVGLDCSVHTKCQSDCNWQGFCTSDSECACYPGYIDRLCQTWVDCPRNCTSELNGVCEPNGQCRCFSGYFGRDCGSYSMCGNCVNGSCRGEVCECEAGWMGAGCNQVVEPVVTVQETETEEVEEADIPSTITAQTSNVTDITTLNFNETATTTSSQPVPSSESSSTTPVPISAIQLSSTLPDTGILRSYPCPNNCNYNGLCKDGVCFCTEQFTGTTCEVRVGNKSGIPLVVVGLFAVIAIGLGLCAGVTYAKRTQRLQGSHAGYYSYKPAPTHL